MAALPPGSPAPEFTLASHLGDKSSLTKGRKALVAFLPFAFTGG
jgi:peroxiredoxin